MTVVIDAYAVFGCAGAFVVGRFVVQRIAAWKSERSSLRMVGVVFNVAPRRWESNDALRARVRQALADVPGTPSSSERRARRGGLS